MRHEVFPTHRRAAPPAPGEALTPAAYLRLRREAAGLTIQQVAERVAPRLADRAAAVDLIEQLETPGIRARRRWTLERLRTAFRFDADVYVQLAKEAPERQPRICRGCGCSLYDPCLTTSGYCRAPTDGICSCCAERE